MLFLPFKLEICKLVGGNKKIKRIFTVRHSIHWISGATRLSLACLWPWVFALNLNLTDTTTVTFLRPLDEVM